MKVNLNIIDAIDFTSQIKVDTEIEVNTGIEIEAIDVPPPLDSITNALITILTQFTEFDKYTLAIEMEKFYITGDFYGDGASDIAVLVKIANQIKIGIIDYGKDTLLNYWQWRRRPWF